MRPDKQKVIDEVWDDERIRSFLDKGPMGDEPDPDYSILLNAYRAMRPEDFARFLALFTAAGRNLDARGRNGRTLLQTIARHEQAGAFRQLLQDAGASA